MLNYKLKITDKDNDGCIVEDYNVSDHLKQLLNKLDQESLERLFERDAYKDIIINSDILSYIKNKHIHLINNHQRIFYKSNLIKPLPQYNPYYPKKYYIFWEIISNTKSIMDKNNFLFLDDGDSDDLGHIEATINYCENNQKPYENNQYIRLPLNAMKMTSLYKTFSSVYSNHKVFSFTDKDYTIVTGKKIINYFQSNKFNFSIGVSDIFTRNLLGIVNLNLNGSSIIYIKNFLNSKYDCIIEYLRSLFEEIYIYKPEIDKCFHSCYLIMINLQKNDDDILKKIIIDDNNIDIIKKINNHRTNLYHIKKKYFNSINDQLLNMYSKTTIDYKHNDTNKSLLWANKYNIELKNKEKDVLMLYNEKAMSYNNYKVNKNNWNDLLEGDQIYDSLDYDLHYIKRRLNRYKRVIDTKEQFIDNDYELDIIDWNKLTDCIDLHRNLKKIISWKFNGEYVTNIWLKFYEIFSLSNIFNKGCHHIKTFHLSENTGSIILALNHFIKSNNITSNFQWFAQCPQNKFIGRCNLIKLFPENWILDRDIFNIKTLEYYLNDNRLQDIDFITCDGSLKTPPDKFNEQEKYVSQYTYSQFYLAINILPQGKNKSMLLKLYLPMIEDKTLAILYILSIVFDDVQIIKPTTSHTGSSEVYCLAKGYHGYNSISSDIKSKLTDVFLDFRIELLNKNTMNKTFLQNIENISKELSERQILSIKRSLFLRDVYFYDYDIQREISDTRESFTKFWIKSTNILPINDNDKIENK